MDPGDKHRDDAGGVGRTMVGGHSVRTASRMGRRFEGLLGLSTHTNVIPARVAETHFSAGPKLADDLDTRQRRGQVDPVPVLAE